MIDAIAVKGTLSALLRPPGLPLLLIAAGLLAGRRFPRFGRLVVGFGLLAAIVLSSATGAWALAWLLERGQQAQTVQSLRALLEQPDPPRAVVILGAGTRAVTRESPYAEFVKPLGLERLVHGAWVAEVTGLPVLVTGGPPRSDMASEASVMKRTLESRLSTPVRWVEERARDTADNARFTAALLADAQVSRILLVTQAYHMPRAREAFERVGLRVDPAPHGFSGDGERWGLTDLLPSAASADLAARATHELLGRAWYGLRAGAQRTGAGAQRIGVGAQRIGVGEP